MSGHVLGGGYGYLARPLGLACDNILSVDFVNAQGQAVHADAHHNSDLFWACRGGGGGSFGAATSFLLQLHSIRMSPSFPNILVRKYPGRHSHNEGLAAELGAKRGRR